MIFSKFFDIFSGNYLDDGVVLVAQEFGVFMDIQNLPIHTIMAMVKAAGASVEARKNAQAQANSPQSRSRKPRGRR